MAISEIEKLERRYAENPHGYSFAPLAEAYRKSTDHPRALDVLKRGLELHPDYVPASIVLGRVHLDLADDGSAELAFSHVLTLDPENVIALKAMADITERANRPADAARWLELLLAVDRSNEEARAQLDRLAASRPSWPEPAPIAEAEALPEQEADAPVGTLEQAFEAATGSGTTTVGAGEIPSEEPSEPVEYSAPLLPEMPPPPIPDEPSPIPGLQAADSPLAGAGALESSAPPEGFESPLASFVEEGLSSTPETHASDLSLEKASHVEFQLPDMSQEFSVELRSSGANEFQLPSASDEFSSLRPSAEQNEYQLPDASRDFVKRVEPPPAEPRIEPVAPPETPVKAAAAAPEPPPPAIPSWALWSGGAAGEPAATPSIEPPVPSEAAPAAAFAEPPSPPELPREPWPLEEEEPEPVATESAAVRDELEEQPVVDAEETFFAAFAAPDPDPIAEPEPVVRAPEPSEDWVAAGPAFADAASEVPSEPPAPIAAEADDSDPFASAAAAENGDPGFVPEPEPIVTESMAELFLRQGHRLEALRVYRELVHRRPDDARLAAKIIELESAEVVVSPLPVGQPSFAAGSTGGTSVRELLRAILVSRPMSAEGQGTTPGAGDTGGDKPDDASGAPTRPAPDHLSLSQIFGDEGPPLPPAVRVAPTPPSRSGMSFDEFYGAGGANTASRESTIRRDRSASGGDDLDQFHNWLQNLKR